MAQASPKSTSAKSAPTEAETTETSAGKPKKKMLIIAGVVLILLIAGGSAAAYFFMHKPGNNLAVAKKEDLKPPVFLPLDNFTVNLSPDDGDKYLQVTLTLQVPDEKDADNIKAHMPQVRDRVLLLLSSQKASDLLTEAGKNQLTREIISAINKPFDPAGDPQKVSGVFFTSFVIQ
ncbi:MAG: flagellar basal body-associated protein FliL [Betaproteobacteria bacterium]|nr:flagellar basal body-associated protein FliL [Betaproteobacteria bacterium]